MRTNGTDITRQITEILGLDSDHFGDASFTTKNSPSAMVDDADADHVIVRRGHNPDTVFVGYLTDDDSPTDFLAETRELGEFVRFDRGTRDSATAKLETAKAAGKLILPVEKYEHSNVHYSVFGTASYADRQFDVGAIGVFIPGDNMQRIFRETQGLAKTAQSEESRIVILRGGLDDIIKEVNSLLDGYSKWCNGEVYAAIVETWEIDREKSRLMRTNIDGMWDLVGDEHANAELKQQMSAAAPAPVVEAAGVDAPAP